MQPISIKHIPEKNDANKKPVTITSHYLDIRAGRALWHQYGGAKPGIYFTPANGFPVRSYDFFLRKFKGYGSIAALEHRAMWPHQQNPGKNVVWVDYVDDLEEVLDSQSVSVSSPVIGIGHSLGGWVTLACAVKRPELFSGLVLIDPAYIDPLVEKSPGIDTVPDRQDNLVEKLVIATLCRQTLWSSRERFIEFLGNCPAYEMFSKAAMEDYATFGLEKIQDSQYRLNYSPVWEAHNFRQATSLEPLLAKVNVPTLFIYGENSFLYPEKVRKIFQKNCSPTVIWKPVANAGHLAIQENPGEVHSLISEWISEWKDE